VGDTTNPLVTKSSAARLLVWSLLAAELAVVCVVYIVPLSTRQRWSAFFLATLVVVLLVEIGFRVAYRLKTGRTYVRIPKVRFDKLYVEPHPFLPVVYKKGMRSQRAGPSHYPLQRDRGLMLCEVRSNNFRHVDGPSGDRPIVVPKPAGQIRILCLGASQTGNYLELNGERYSYPMELEKLLRARFPDTDVVVHNCGHGGWTSAEILIDFELNLYDTNPDVIILYHAYNDLQAGLTPGFETDYSHYRRNLGEIYHLYRWASYIPDAPLLSYNFLVNSLFPFTNPRFGLNDVLSKAAPDLSAPFAGLETYGRNLEHIIKICRASGIQVVLGSVAQYVYDEIKRSPVHVKYREGLVMENRIVQNLARKYGLPFVDQFNLIPSEERYFVDSVHFSPEGMRLAAEHFERAVAQVLDRSVGAALRH
jgi:lysophospholipase L1-like esterase